MNIHVILYEYRYYVHVHIPYIDQFIVRSTPSLLLAFLIKLLNLIIVGQLMYEQVVMITEIEIKERLVINTRHYHDHESDLLQKQIP